MARRRAERSRPRPRSGLALALLLFTLAPTACRTQPRTPEATPDATVQPRQVPDGPVRLVVTADLAGHLEPCGCVADMLGGLARTAGRIQSLSTEGPTLFLDAGHTFPGPEEFKGASRDQARAKSRALMDLLKFLDVQVLLTPADQQVERTLGEDWGSHRLLEFGRAIHGQKFVIGGVSLAVVGASFKALPESGESDGVLAERLKNMMAEAIGVDGPPDFRMVVLATGAKTARRLASLLEGEVDLIAVSGLDAANDGDRARVIDAAVPILRPLSQGRGLAVVEIRIPPGAVAGSSPLLLASPGEGLSSETEERIARFQERAEAANAEGKSEEATFYEKKVASLRKSAETKRQGTDWPTDRGAFRITFEEITAELPEAPWAKARIERYDQEVAAANMAWSQTHARACPSPAEGGPSYLGAKICEGCHSDATAFWKTTPHAHAWTTLVKDEKTADLECVGCHSTGWQRDGGVCQLHRVETGLGAGASSGGVQCEACHGPGSQHVSSGGETELRRNPPSGVCRQCHRGLHSPEFDPAIYRPRILGPGHGGTAADTPR